MGNISTLEPTNNDIVGAQVNYSCFDNCVLRGSSSLRCKRVVSGPVVIGSEWVNGSDAVEYPSCYCASQLHFSDYVD